jgi:hypothetical protein
VESVQERIETEFFGEYSHDERQLFKQMLTRMREVAS